jgi:chemotaxis signal transduction protein
MLHLHASSSSSRPHTGQPQPQSAFSASPDKPQESDSTNNTNTKKPKTVDVLAFSTAQRSIAVELRFVVEVFVTGHITPVPLAPRCLPGTTNLRGQVITLIDVAALIDDKKQSCCLPGDSALLVQHGSMRGGLLLERVIDVYRLLLSSYENSPKNDLLFPGAFRCAAGPITLLDIGAALQNIRRQSHAAARRILEEE